MHWPEHPDAAPTPSPRLSGERAGAKGFDLKNDELLTPQPSTPLGRRERKPGSGYGMRRRPVPLPTSSSGLFQHGLDPRLVIEIPANGFTDAVFKFVRGRPAKFALDFCGVNGVTAIVAGAIFHKSDEFA